MTFAEVLLGRAVGRAVVVGQVEVGDAQVEGAAQDGAAGLEYVLAAEVLPQAQRDRRQVQAAAAGPAIGHGVIAGGIGDVGLLHGGDPVWGEHGAEEGMTWKIPFVIPDERAARRSGTGA
jgi:hypothetical protein